jgi:hypothetical protein
MQPGPDPQTIGVSGRTSVTATARTSSIDGWSDWAWRGGIMEPKQIFKQMFDFNKTAFENGFKTMVMLQDQAERMANVFMEQSPWLPEEGKKAINDWISSFKKARDNFKKTVDESVKKVEDYFAEVQ